MNSKTEIQPAAIVFLVAVLLVGAAALPLQAECAPQRMVKIVFFESTPGLDARDPRAAPRTLYRHGTRYGRAEETLNPQTGSMPLFIVAEPDIWMTDARLRKGVHMIDKGPPVFTAPLLRDRQATAGEQVIELGCEMDYMREHATQPMQRVEVDGRSLNRWEARIGELTAILLIERSRKHPQRFWVEHADDGIIYRIEYLTYETDLEPDFRLFGAPKGFEIREQKMPVAPPQTDSEEAGSPG